MTSMPISLRLSDKTRARLEVEARRDERPLSQVASRAITAWLDAQDELRRQINEAAEEADRGVFVSREAVGAWMDGWGTDAEAPMPGPDVCLGGEASGAGGASS